jgi:dihydroorotase
MDAQFDMLLRGGRVIDPASGRDGVADVAIRDNVIAAIEPAIPTAAARQVLDVSGRIVTAGLIDTHAHVYEHVTGRFGLNADMVGIRSGVTTLVDQGGPSCMTIPGFRHFIVEPAESRVLCFISMYLVGGMEGHLYPALYGPEQVDVKATIRAGRANSDIVKGVKAHAEIGGASRWGLEVVKLGKRIASELGVPLYIHLGQIWPLKDGVTIDPDEVVRELMPIMEPGDVLAHPFTRHPGGFVSVETGQVHPVVWAALDRGVTVDVGHGSHFSFEMARRTLTAGIRPNTLGADMHGYNVNPPGTGKDAAVTENPFAGTAPFNLTIAMTELMALGLTLPEIVATVTRNPALMLRMQDTLGTLAVGREADVSVLNLLRGRFTLSDNSGETLVTDQMLTPDFALRAGQRVLSDSPLIPPAELLAA